MSMRAPCRLLAAALLVSAASTGAAQDTTPGASRQSAIEVCMPPGQREYLSRLACADGSRPAYERVGSVGNRNPLPADLDNAQRDRLLQAMLETEPLADGAVDYHVVDLYRLSCGAQHTEVHLDMYHCDAAPPGVAPAGFSLQP